MNIITTQIFQESTSHTQQNFAHVPKINTYPQNFAMSMKQSLRMPTNFSHIKHFSKLFHIPSSISINISLDLCVLSIFITHPFLVKPIFFASKWLPPPRDLLFLLLMVRNMIQHLIGMMMMDFFKTLGPMLHIVM